MDTASEKSFSSLTTLDDAIAKDKQRYIRKGYGLIFAILSAITIFWLAPYAVQSVFALFTGWNQIQTQIVLILASGHLSYAIGNCYMWVIYTIQCPFFERYKIDENPWPWLVDKEAWEVKKRKVLKNYLINSVLGAGLIIYSALQQQIFRFQEFPTHFEIIWQTAFCMIAEDMTFYWSHRLLHHPKLYPLIHKQHHEFYSPISFSAEYAHPVEFILGNSIPTMVGPLFLRDKMHLGTLCFWLILRVFETIDGHCGYEFSWSPYRLLPFSGSAEYHHFHHSHNVGNYSSFFYYWDSLCGTNKPYFKFKEIKKRELQLEALRSQFKAKPQ